MLSEKPWKSEAVLRLGLGVIVCACMGAVMAGAAQVLGGAGKVNPFVFFSFVAAAFVFLGGVLFLIRRPWPLEKATFHFLAMLVCFYGVLIMGYFTQHFVAGPNTLNPALRVAIAALGFQGASLVLVHRFLREHGMRWEDGFGLRNGWKQTWLPGVAVGCVYLPIGWSLQLLSALALTHLQTLTPLDVAPVEQQAVQVLKAAEGWANRAVIGATAIILAPLAEEILFRGILYPTIKQAGWPRAALWVSALLFAVVHFNLVTFVPLFLLAVALTLLYEKTDNLLAPIVAHSAFNAANFAMLFWFEDIARWFQRAFPWLQKIASQPPGS